MLKTLMYLTSSPVNLVHNFQLGSYSISYEAEFLNAKGAEPGDVESVRHITEDELRQAFRAKYGDRDPKEVMEEILKEQSMPDHFDLNGPVYAENSLSSLMDNYYTNYGNRLPDFKAISSQSAFEDECGEGAYPAPALDCAVEPEGNQPKPDVQEQVVLRSWVNQKTGFKHKIIRWTFNGNPDDAVDVENVYNLNDEYVGDKDIADMLYKRGIRPELADPSHNVCSIGYCEREDKWYGWSHRALFGFGIGNAVRKGDCAYTPATKEDFIESLRAWHDDGITEKEDIKIIPTLRGARVTYKYANSELSYDNEEEFKPGRGEWQANTLEEAKQMAINFAESVSTVTNEVISSESASKKQFPPTSYAWYTFGGKRTKEFEHHNKRSGISMSLENGEKFGIVYNEKTKLVHLVEKENLEYEFRLEPRLVKLWLKKSKGFGGKIQNQKVQRGNGQVDQLKTRNLIRPQEPGVVLDSHTGAKVKVDLNTKKRPTKVSSIDTSKTIYGAFFKPNADIDKEMLVVDNSLAELKKTVKVKMLASKNLGSKPTFIAIPNDHRMLAKIRTKGFGYFSPAHMLILKKDSTEIASNIKNPVQLNVEGITLNERSPDKLVLKAPFFDGNQQEILKELRDEVVNHKKLSGNLTYNGKSGLFKKGKLIYLELMLPNASNVCKKEAKAFTRRLEVQSRKKFKVQTATIKVDKMDRDVVRIFVNVVPFAEGSKDFAKRLRTLEANDTKADKLSDAIRKLEDSLGPLNIQAKDKELSAKERSVAKAQIAVVKRNIQKAKTREGALREEGTLDPVVTYNLNPSTEPGVLVNFDHIDYKKPAVMVRMIRGSRANNVSVGGPRSSKPDYSGKSGLIPTQRLYDMTGKIKVI